MPGVIVTACTNESASSVPIGRRPDHITSFAAASAS